MKARDTDRSKPFERLVLTIVLAAAASVLVMVIAAAQDARFVLVLAAVLFAAHITLTATRINAPLMSGDHVHGEIELVTSVLQNSVVTALVYGWGAAAMLTIYHLSGLSWRHGWQYGCAMALIALGIFVYTRWLRTKDSRLRTRRALAAVTTLGALQGFGIIAALTFLVLSGKLATPKSDWAANIIFVTGGVILVFLSLISVQAYRKLTMGRSGQ